MDIKKFSNGKYLVDLKGLVCPYPVLFTKRALEKLKSGEILEIVIDNPPSLDTVLEAVKASGHEIVEVIEMEPSVWKISVRKR
ncbi:MAG: sulfurtransferase TusA family protein [Candidatus Micrarchaeia archaeon]